MTTLDIGMTAPDFTLPTDNATDISLSELSGKTVVLFFYPKDNTSGCTTEAIGFSAKKAEFEAANTVVIGVSPDSIASHCKFRDKHDLTVMLAADESTSMLQAYGVWAEKSMYGKKYFGVVRTTFVIDAQGRIAHAWHKVKVPGHVDEVLTAVQSLHA